MKPAPEKRTVAPAKLPALNFQSFLKSRDRAQALREVDRFWRTRPQDRDALVMPYVRLLLDNGEYAVALRIVLRASTFSSDADLEGLAVLALYHSKREWAALQRLDEALKRFVARPRGELVRSANILFDDAGLGIPGWFGLTPDWTVHGQVRCTEPDPKITAIAQHDDGSERCLAVHAAASSEHFSLTLSNREPARLRLATDTAQLLGSGVRFPPDPNIDGRAWIKTGRKLEAWARSGWDPHAGITLYLQDESGAHLRIKPNSKDALGAPQQFSLDLANTGLKGDRIQISAHIKSGPLQPLPDSPLLLGRAVQRFRVPPARVSRPATGRHKPLAKDRTPARGVRVIVPVYRGLDETLLCLDSVIASKPAYASIIVVDDATPEPALAAALDTYAARGQIELLRNTENLGFVGSVNRALALCIDQDAILLNSDTCVFGNWIDRLRNSAYSQPDIGSVTPFSNDGTIVSYPLAASITPSRAESMAFDQRVARLFAGRTVDLPVGVGFCLYIRNDCLRETGPLNEALFGKGYGEESDFCMRARALGWRHVLGADTYVYHSGGRSFGTRRAALLARAGRLINLRHPGYDRLVKEFIEADPIGPLRRALDIERLLEVDRPLVLLVTLAGGGGVDRYVIERARKLQAQGFVPLALGPLYEDSTRTLLASMSLPLQHLSFGKQDIGALTHLLHQLVFTHIEIHHFLELEPKVLDCVRQLPAPFDIYVHDYLWVCPRITMIDGSGRYCGEPAISVCESCVKKNGSALDESISVRGLRARSARWMAKARRVIAPTGDVARRLQRYFPTLNIDIQPSQPVMTGLIARDSALNEWTFDDQAQPTLAPRAVRKRMRVASIGAIGRHKGYDVLLACARDAAARKLPIEFTIIGYTHDDARLMKTGKVEITGRFEEGEAQDLLKRENPDLVFLASVCPETWCYTLTEVINAGLPVVAFDLGSIADRLRVAGLGNLLSLETSPKALNEFFLGATGTLIAPPRQ